MTNGSEFNRVKRALFDKYFARLNEAQREAVYTTEGPLLVLAGAGSGKTTVIVNRIANIIRFGRASQEEALPAGASELLPEMKRISESGSREEAGEMLDALAVEPAMPYQVLCLTFTNKAASEFKARLTAMLSEKAGDIWAGTFHSICVRILRRHISELGYRNDFTIYDSDDSRKLISEILKELGVAESVLPPRAAMKEISDAKNNDRTPEDELADAGRDVRKKKLAEAYRRYQKRLFDASALDFDDIIMLTVRLLREFPELRERYRRQFEYILIDEYQDTNPSQAHLARLLTGEKSNICVVGDDDQSIYSFRGATVDNILGFDTVFKNAKTVRLERNYRSTGNILKAANGIISNNIGRKGKELWTSEPDGEPIHIKRLYTQTEEAGFICGEIAKRVADGAKYSDFAVLYRVNAISATLESAFVKKRIPYRIYGGIRFFERREIKDILAYLSLMVNPADTVRLLRIINVPKRSVGEATIERARELSRSAGKPIFDIIANAGSYPELKRVSPKLERFGRLINELREYSLTHTLAETVERVIDESGYRKMLREEEGGEEREQNVMELVTSAALFAETAPEPTLSAFLNELALVSDLDNYDADSDAVVLMTVHSAKGLEFPVVFVPGFEEGLFPSSQSVSAGDRALEEERRLAYVAVTRAKREVFLLHVATRMLYGRTETRQTSRFAAEIPAEAAERGAVKDSGGHAVAPVSAYSARHTQSRKSFLESIKQNAEKTPACEELAAGARVRHAMFGAGRIVSAEKMGADMLYEIEFDSGSVKRLMGSFAKLKRIDD